MAMHQNGLYSSEFFNIILYVCMSPICHENDISLDSIAQSRVLFPDDGLINSLRNIKNSLHNLTAHYLTGLNCIRSSLIYFRLQITLKMV